MTCVRRLSGAPRTGGSANGVRNFQGNRLTGMPYCPGTVTVVPIADLTARVRRHRILITHRSGHARGRVRSGARLSAFLRYLPAICHTRSFVPTWQIEAPLQAIAITGVIAILVQVCWVYGSGALIVTPGHMVVLDRFV